MAVGTLPQNTVMRLTPIEHPRGLLLPLAYAISRKAFGKVLSALRIIYARSVPALRATVMIARMERRLSLPPATRALIRYFTAHLNSCSFCADLSAYYAAREGLAFREWQEYLHFRDSARFSDREKALLAYLEGIAYTATATEETFGELRRWFSEKEIVEITWLNATEHYFNRMAKPLGLRSDDLRPAAAPGQRVLNDPPA